MNESIPRGESGVFCRIRRCLTPVFLCTLVVVSVFGSVNRCMAQEAISQEEPPPSSVDDMTTPIERSFRDRIGRAGLFPRLKEWLKEAPPFFRDTKLDLHIRSYYLRQVDDDDRVSSAWAMGGALAYKSGWLHDRVMIGTTFYWSKKIYGPEDQDGTSLLKPGQRSYSVLGQLYGRVKLFEEHLLNLYRYTYNTPFIGKNDSRMTPNTFEGYTLQGVFGGKDGAPGLRYGGGYITRIKERNSDDFISMSEAAGADVKRGVGVAGVLFTYRKFSLGAINYYSDDIINIFYTESRYRFSITKDIGVSLAFQFTDQRSTGRNLLNGRSFVADQVGIKGDASYGGAILTLAYTNTLRGEDMQSPWSAYPGYTSVQVEDFDRANEQALLTKFSYHFSRLGLADVTASALFVHAWGRVDPSTGRDVPNENECDIDVQWRPKRGFLNGFSARLRYAFVHPYQGTKNNIHEYRLIMNYQLPLF